MTREEAIYELKRDIHNAKVTHHLSEHYEMAIKALEQEPCEDCVDRAEIKKIAKEMYLEVANMKLDVKTIPDCISYTSSKCREVLERKVQTLPSVTPIRPKGHWIYDKSFANWICSKCGETPKTIGYVGTGAFMAEHFKYCNHCGAEMDGVEEK